MACITDKSSSKKYFMNEKEYTQLQNTRKEQEKNFVNNISKVLNFKK